MEKSIELLVSNLQNHPHYPDLVELLVKNRPRVPLFDPGKGNAEDWKYRSGQQRGYDYFAALLNIKFED